MPAWEHYEAKDGEIIVTMDPGMAFGTGTHETTRLVIRLMQDEPLESITLTKHAPAAQEPKQLYTIIPQHQTEAATTFGVSHGYTLPGAKTEPAPEEEPAAAPAQPSAPAKKKKDKDKRFKF